MARRECKARSVLNKWKETENRALNGGGPEDDAAGESMRMIGATELDLITGWRLKFCQARRIFVTCYAVYCKPP